VTTGALRLYGYWRSSAVYRVRIALNLKKLDYENFPVHLVRDGGEQHAAPYRDLNPQELVPVLLHGSRILRQSMAIIEYLDETFSTGDYCDGEGPTMADCCLVPQVYVANRFGVDLAPYPTIRRINATCLALEAFEAARPENQPDAPAAG
jgi:glutathione S-transferase